MRLQRVTAKENSPVFMENKSKMKWADKESGLDCFMLFAKSLYITWGGHENWVWNCFKETGEEKVEVAKLSHVCWLDVKGKFSISELRNGAYEVVYVVKMRKDASGWELPINLKLSLPNGQVRHRQVVMLEKPKAEWIELIVGNFLVGDGQPGEVSFDLFEHGGHWKTGLIIKCAIIRPIHQ